MTSSFVPKGREELLLRTPLTFGFTGVDDVYRPRHGSASNDELRSAVGESREEQRTKMRQIPRNNPHTARLKSMKGLTEHRICSVEDNKGKPRPMSALSSRDLGSGYRPPGSSRYAANSSKNLFAVGVVPVTYAWRDELIKKAEKAINRALGREASVTSRAGLGSRRSSRGAPKQFEHLNDQSLLDMMCQILHTSSIPTCQEWLHSAPDDEKDIVLNMIRMAALKDSHAEATPTRPPTQEYRYVWKPDQSRRYSDPCLGDQLDLSSLNINPRFLFQEGGGRESGLRGGGGGDGQGGGGREGGGGRGGGRVKKRDDQKQRRRDDERQSRAKRSKHREMSSERAPTEYDIYKTIAAESILKQKAKNKKRDSAKHTQQDTLKSLTASNKDALPPILPPQLHKSKHRSSEPSKHGATAMEGEHLVSGGWRGGEERGRGRSGDKEKQFTSHWKDIL